MEEKIGYYIKKLSFLINQELRDNSYGLSGSQCFLINYINKNGNEVRQSELDKIFCVRRSSITNLIHILLKEGYIETYSSELDRRVKMIKLSKKGLEIAEKMNEAIENNEKKLSNSLSEEEFNTLLELLKKISKSYNNEEERL